RGGMACRSGTGAVIRVRRREPGVGSYKIALSLGKTTALLTVIIPVFLGLRETQRCVESVLAARCETAHEVVVIDDASPDSEIAAWLGRVERSGRIRLIVHPANRGFVASVNEGMENAPGFFFIDTAATE